MTLEGVEITLCVCKLHFACRNHIWAYQNHTHACENHTRACGNPTLRVEITLLRDKITLGRVFWKNELVFAKIYLKIEMLACEFTRKRIIFTHLRAELDTRAYWFLRFNLSTERIHEIVGQVPKTNTYIDTCWRQTE
jgi:hypothetical protein